MAIFAEQLRIASANLQEGGLDTDTGSDVRWHKTIDALAGWEPHIVLVQEMRSPSPQHTLRQHLYRTANALRMTPVLGRSARAGQRELPGDTDRSLQRPDGADDGPWPAPGAPPWCHALVQVQGMANPMRFYSVHLPARSVTAQLGWAEYLANRIAQLGELTVAGGDWNGFSRADAAQLTPHHLEHLPPHLIPPRMRYNAAGERLPSYDVHDVLDSTGLIDAAAHLPPDRRDPRELTPTGRSGAGRIDRFYTTLTLTPAIRGYRQQNTGGSDHHAILLTIDLTAAAAVIPREPLP